MLAEFFEWWGRNLLEMVPPRWREGAGANALVADATVPGVIAFARRRRGGEARLGQARADDPALARAIGPMPSGETVVLRLPASAVLERPVQLPLAAERDPERVLAYDMERLTPFGANEVFWGYSVENRDRARNRLSLRLALVPRATVAGLIDALAAAGARPSLIEAQTATGAQSIRLEHEARKTARLSPRNAAIVLGALALLALFSPFLRQSVELAGAQSRLASLAPQFRVVEALRARINGGGSDVVVREARRLGDTLGALAAITEILPDDSYLTEFSMRERKMTLSGLSASAPRLISALSGDARIRNPAFTAPVTRAEASHDDVFTIRADLAD